MELLKNSTAHPMIAVTDIKKARDFYENTLGLKIQSTGMPEIFEFLSGDSTFQVYESDYAGTNKANTLSWDVGNDFNKLVDYLKSKKVKFNRYPDLDEKMELDGDIHKFGDTKMIWIEDPDGNILHIRS